MGVPGILKEVGTPLGPRSTKILLLGGGELGKELAIEAQRLGLEVVVIDRYQFAPAMHVAHRYYVIDMLNKKALKAIVKKENPLAIIPEIEAVNTEALVELEEEGYHVVPNAKAVAIAMNRVMLRKFVAEELGLPTTRYAFAENEDEVLEACEKVGYPCLIKPEMSSSGHGHVRIDRASNKKDIINAYRKSISHARGASRRVIVEEYVQLKSEFTLLAYRWIDGNKVSTSYMQPVEHWRYGKYHYIESWQPSNRPKDIVDRVAEIGTKIANSLGGVGIYATEILYTRDGRLLFSEVAPRPHDTGMVTLMSQDLSEFSVHVRASVGLPVPEIALLTPAASIAIYTDYENEWFPSLKGVYDALALNGVNLRWFGKPSTYRGRRMAIILARGRNVNEALERARKAASLVAIAPPIEE